jgi:hypothetical protein
VPAAAADSNGTATYAAYSSDPAFARFCPFRTDTQHLHKIVDIRNKKKQQLSTTRSTAAYATYSSDPAFARFCPFRTDTQHLYKIFDIRNKKKQQLFTTTSKLRNDCFFHQIPPSKKVGAEAKQILDSFLPSSMASLPSAESSPTTALA